ncbi:MAG: hypothetical protein ACI835_005859, partial [Planctomycetota bacterium]
MQEATRSSPPKRPFLSKEGNHRPLRVDALLGQGLRLVRGPLEVV